MNPTSPLQRTEYGNSRSTVHPVAEHHPAEDLVHYLKEYTREKPEVVAMWCLGIGFILGWKLKPW